ncbi:amino acid permease [Acidimicrobiaceae bacterium USS-CC1]|uniref:Amino acid permease n=1 Tax=Acidiferrimicrobium australe TaxID=2664430 RepID=A0ABW9QPK4_9ACTN|nr:amino acid permease [Acidiferrimicrobium australe]
MAVGGRAPVARLQKNVLSVPNGIALAAAAMAPVLAVVLNAPAAAPEAGAALPLSFLVAFVVCLLMGNTVTQFARHMPSAGSFYTFNTAGLGQGAGFFTGWMFWIGYAVLAPGLMDAFGSFAHDYVLSVAGASVPWWIFSLAAMAVVIGLSVRSIKASVSVDLTLLTLEVLIFCVLAVIAIADAGHGNTVRVFAPSSSPRGISGVGFGVVFGILSFIGFDAAATLGEETRNPRRNVPVAVGGALVFVGVFYVFAMYALTAGLHLDQAGAMARFLKDANPFVTLAHQDASWLVQPVDLAALAGIFSCFLAIHNTTVRVMFSMGRDQVLPRSIGRVHRSWHSPHLAIVAQTVFTLVVGLATGAWLGPGATGAYGFTGAIGTVAIVVVYMASSVALMRWFWQRPDRNLVLHIIVPALSVLGLAYPLYSVVKPGQSWPYNLVFWVALAWVAAGVALYLWYRSRSPEKITRLGSFLAEEGDDYGGAVTAARPVATSLGETPA